MLPEKKCPEPRQNTEKQSIVDESGEAVKFYIGENESEDEDFEIEKSKRGAEYAASFGKKIDNKTLLNGTLYKMPAEKEESSGDEETSQNRQNSSLKLFSETQLKYISIQDKISTLIPIINFNIKPKFTKLENRNYLISFVDKGDFHLPRLHIVLLNPDFMIYKIWTSYIYNIHYFALETHKNRIVLFYRFYRLYKMEIGRRLCILNDELQLINEMETFFDINSLALDNQDIFANSICLNKGDIVIKNAVLVFDQYLRIRNRLDISFYVSEIFLNYDDLFLLFKGKMLILNKSLADSSLQVFNVKGKGLCFDCDGNYLTFSHKKNIIYRYARDGNLFEQITVKSDFLGFLVEQNGIYFVFI